MKLLVKKATTDVTVYVFIQDSTVTTGAGKTGLVYNSSGLVCYYVRPLAAAAALSLVTQTVTGAHSDGGFVEVDATNMPGVYRLDLSDAICATAVNSVVVMLKGATGMAPLLLEIQLVNFDPNANLDANLVAIDGQATSGNNATLKLKQLDIQNSAGTAVIAKSTGSNGRGVDVAGNGTGAGMYVEGGATGHGGHFKATGISKIALECEATGTNGKGLDGVGTFGITTNAQQVALETTLQAVDVKVDGVQADTDDIQTRLPAALVSGRMSSDAIAISGSTAAADSVEANIGNLDAAITTRSTITTAQVNTEVDTALADINLDHLVGTATGIPAIPAGTYIDQLMDDGTATYDRTTDSLQAIRDNIAAGSADWTTVEREHIRHRLGIDGTATAPTATPSLATATAVAAVAAAVWAVGTRTLTSFGTLVSDTATAVWAAGTRTLTSFGTLVADVATAVWGAVARTLTAISDSAGVTTLLTRIPGTVQPQTGDSYARLGAPAGASVSVDVAAVKTDSGNLVTRLGTPASSTVAAKIDTLHDTRIPGVIQPQTGDSFARLGAPVGASVSVDVAAVKSDTGTTSTNVSTVLSRLGAITGTGVNTVLGFFKALLSKTASIPTDIGGTFDPATDSTEAIRDRGDAAWVTGTAAPTADDVALAVMRRDVDGDAAAAAKQSVCNAVLALTSRQVDDGAGHLKTYRKDGTTVILTQAITTDAAALPVKELGVGA